MKAEDCLYIVYTLDQRKDMSRVVKYVYSLKGMMNLDELLTICEDPGVKRVIGGIGPFETEESLTRFAFQLSEKYKYAQVCLCNSEAVNKALLETTSITSLNETLLTTGEILENPDASKRGFFSGILN